MAPYWPGKDNWAVLQASMGAGRSATALLVLAVLTQTESRGTAFDIASGLIYTIFGVVYLWGLWRAACRGKRCFQGEATTAEAVIDGSLRASFYIFFCYALFVATVFHAWYLLWFIPLAAVLLPDRRITSGATVFSLAALLIIPYYETIRVWIPYLNQNHLLGHAIGVSLLLVPVLFSLWKPIQLLPEKT